jgi:TPR repeat protein
VLNACFSLPQARAIADVVGCAIGTGGGISDEAAITFGASFYSAIAFGCSVQAAYDQARAALALDHFDDRECPQLVVAPGIDPTELFLISAKTGGPGEMEEAGPRGQVPTPAPAPTVKRRRMGRVGKTIVALALTGAAVIASVNLPPRVGSPKGSCTLAAGKEFNRVGNDTAAFLCFKLAAAAGNLEATGLLGVAYLYGQGTERQPALAIEWLRRAAYKRDRRGMNELATAYQNGNGVSRNGHWARYWYRVAAKHGYPEAMRNLGNLFENEQSYDSAHVWYRTAARAGSLDAMIDGGRMYENGVGTPQNLEEARRLYRTAAEAGLIPGMLEMGRIYQNAIGVPQDYEKARAWYEKAAAAGSGGGMNNLGILYQFGWGVQKDREAALQWYRRAIHAGSTTAAANLRKLEAG